MRLARRGRTSTATPMTTRAIDIGRWKNTAALPSPIDIPAIKGIDVKTEAETERHASDEEPLSMLVFKIANDPHMGSLTFCRICSGPLEQGSMLQNTVQDKL